MLQILEMIGKKSAAVKANEKKKRKAGSFVRSLKRKTYAVRSDLDSECKQSTGKR